jgi:hypothetical protein
MLTECVFLVLAAHCLSDRCSARAFLLAEQTGAVHAHTCWPHEMMHVPHTVTLSLSLSLELADCRHVTSSAMLKTAAKCMRRSLCTLFRQHHSVCLGHQGNIPPLCAPPLQVAAVAEPRLRTFCSQVAARYNSRVRDPAAYMQSILHEVVPELLPDGCAARSKAVAKARARGIRSNF